MRKQSFITLWLAFLFQLTAIHSDETIHNFVGHHFIASYMGCDSKALTDLDNLEKALEEAARASGAQILSSLKHVFPPDGLTMVILLSESHASIHTYPEYGACFVDLFTCGHTCDSKPFELALETYLKPEFINKRLLLRHSDIQDE
jgi:S-adenosylmethionine decarboxylase